MYLISLIDYFSGRTEFQATQGAAAAPRRVGVHFERVPSKRFASRKQQGRNSIDI